MLAIDADLHQVESALGPRIRILAPSLARSSGNYERGRGAMKIILRSQLYKSSQFYSEWPAKMPPFRMKLRTSGLAETVVDAEPTAPVAKPTLHMSK